MDRQTNGRTNKAGGQLDGHKYGHFELLRCFATKKYKKIASNLNSSGQETVIDTEKNYYTLNLFTSVILIKQHFPALVAYQNCKNIFKL